MSWNRNMNNNPNKLLTRAIGIKIEIRFFSIDVFTLSYN